MGKDEFLKKIGVEFPEPLQHPQFGMEQPAVYLDRCMEVLIPAVERYIETAFDMDDFIKYVLQYKPNMKCKINEVKEAEKQVQKEIERPILVENPVVFEGNKKCFIHKKTKKKIYVGEHKSLELSQQISAWFDDNPNGTREECAVALELAGDTVGRYCADLVKAGVLKKERSKYRRHRNEWIKLVRQWFIDHASEHKMPRIREKCASELGCSFPSLRSYMSDANIEYSLTEGIIVKPVESDGKVSTDALVITEPVKEVSETPIVTEKPKESMDSESKDSVEKKFKVNEYMNDLKNRFLNRDKTKIKTPEYLKGVTAAYFETLPDETKKKVITEFWSSTDVSRSEYGWLVECFADKGLRVIKSKLYKMEYEMLKDLLEHGDLSDNVLINKYRDYLRR